MSILTWDKILLFVLTFAIIVLNLVILCTLRSTRRFINTMKLHLGLIALFDILNSILQSSRYILDTKNTLDLPSCKIVLGLNIFTATAAILTNASLSFECLALLKGNVSCNSYIFVQFLYFVFKPNECFVYF